MVENQLVNIVSLAEVVNLRNYDKMSLFIGHMDSFEESAKQWTIYVERFE